MTAMTATTAPPEETADMLADRRTRAEIDRMIADMLKLGAEQNKLAAEQAKLYAEAAKMTRERAWYPAVAMATAAAAGAAIVGVMAKLFG